MEIGLRVVRGPDWHWQMQDSGEGHTGTVVEVGKPGDGSTPDKTVVVQWDSGLRTNYRAGYHGAYDLRIFDNAPIGVRHPNIVCSSCKTEGIQGFRWKCSKCVDLNLCNTCYMNDRHDLNHPFVRFDVSSSSGVKVSRRHDAAKVEAVGLFASAKVVRGPDWDWGNQDGGDGKMGRIVDIRGWDTESGRSVASVVWSSANTNVYRIGHKGKVDLKCVEASVGGHYYRDHLPLLSGESSDAPTSACPPRPKFKVGDKVRVNVDVNVLRAMQEGHGGWNPKMTRHIGKTGKVHRLTERGDIRVQYDTTSSMCKWTLNPEALVKVDEVSVSVGDYVQVSSSVQEVRQLQRGHGEWSDAMKHALGRIGQVVKVYATGDLRVLIDGKQWTFNGACCTLAPHGGQEVNNTTATVAERDSDAADRPNGLAALLRQLTDARLTSSREPEFLVQEAAQGHLDIVQDIIQRHPGNVDTRSSGKTALQVAAHQGHVDIVRLLVEAGASLDEADEDGDFALHFAAFGNQPEVCRLLLQLGAKPNAMNADQCTALHIAVNKKHVACVRVLASACNANAQDKYGDTAVHDAISKDNEEVMNLLITLPHIDLSVRNKRGFNPLHHAALKGNAHAMELLLQRARQLVDGKKEDGFAALHLAALNGYASVASILLTQGQADINITNNRSQTPLMLAVSQGHVSVIELLVSRECSLEAADEDGNTALHLSLAKQLSPTFSATTSLNEIAVIDAELTAAEKEAHRGVAVAIYLTRRGASLTSVNQQGKTPLALVTNSSVAERLQSCHRRVLDDAALWSLQPQSPADQSASNECLVCSDVPASVTFDPCGHCVVCEECSVKVKKCIVCRAPVRTKLTNQEFGARSLKASATMNTMSGRSNNGDARQTPGGAAVAQQSSLGELDELRRQMQQLEDAWLCSVCLDRVRCVAFMCGHSACAQCAHSLQQCHMCRVPIRRKINLF